MVFKKKRSDTEIGGIEAAYGINLNARSDMTLGGILRKRGFDSLSQLLAAYRGKARGHARRRNVFISFHAEDKDKVNGLRLMAHNPYLDLDFNDRSVTTPLKSHSDVQIQQFIGEKIWKSHVLLCLIGNATAWRGWVEWEINEAISLHKGLCGVRIPGTYGKAPDALRMRNAAIATWEAKSIISAIEQASATRS